jgi:molecular chaperone HscB
LREFFQRLSFLPDKKNQSMDPRVQFEDGQPLEARSEMGVTQAQSARATVAKCWSCHRDTSGGHFCQACGKIQPLREGTDYFAFFGLPQKLTLDSQALEDEFHKLSWKLHPDHFMRASEFERHLSLERSSELNDAYRTLRDPISRVEYLLAHLAARKDGALKQQVPPELLEEVFELNESLDKLREARVAGAELAGLRERLSQVQKSFQQRLGEADAELARVGSEWDAALDEHAREQQMRLLVERMNGVLNRRSYIRNLVAGVAKELAEI